MNTLKQDLFDILRPIPFSWLEDNDESGHKHIFDQANPEQREICVWLDGYWKDADDLTAEDKKRGRSFPVFVDPDDSDAWINRIVQSLV